jgi:ribosome-binding factor A
MTTFTRPERVGHHLQKSMMDILKKEIKDPRLEMVTITRVKLTKDLKLAKIYFSMTGSLKSLKDVENAFQSAHGFLKKTLSRELNLRYMPELRFYYDDSLDYASKINELFKSIETDDGKNSPAD